MTSFSAIEYVRRSSIGQVFGVIGQVLGQVKTATRPQKTHEFTGKTRDWSGWSGFTCMERYILNNRATLRVIEPQTFTTQCGHMQSPISTQINSIYRRSYLSVREYLLLKKPDQTDQRDEKSLRGRGLRWSGLCFKPDQRLTKLTKNLTNVEGSEEMRKVRKPGICLDKGRLLAASCESNPFQRLTTLQENRS